MLELNLPTYNYRLEEDNGKLLIFDPIRKKFITLTPEEWVRQHFINLLVNHLNYPASRINVEGGIKYNQLLKRVDLMVLDNTLKPQVLVECKSPSIAISQATLAQLSVYNKVCEAALVVLTNGMVTYAGLCKSHGNFELLERLPKAQELRHLLN